MSFSDTVDDRSTLLTLGSGQCWGKNSKDMEFFVWSILDVMCFTNTQKPYVLLNNLRHNKAFQEARWYFFSVHTE